MNTDSTWLDRCPHCGGKAKLEIEPTSPPHPWSTHTGEWREDAKSAFVRCADCHCGTNCVPEDMWEIVVKRWNKRSNDQAHPDSTPDKVEAAAPFADATGSVPWFVFFYIFAFFLLMEMDWKLGTAWLLWRLGHSAREAWKKTL